MKKLYFTALFACCLGTSHAQMGGLLGGARNLTDKARQAAGTPGKSVVPDATKQGTTSPDQSAAPDAPAQGTISPGKSVVSDAPKQGITSPVHAQNQGKLVFAATPEVLKLKAEQPAAFRTTFQLGTPIYCRIYLARPFLEYVRETPYSGAAKDVDDYANCKVEFYIDGQLAAGNHDFGGQEFTVLGEGTELTTIQDALQPAADGRFVMQDAFKDMQLLNEDKLTPGAHKVRVDLRPSIRYQYDPAVNGDVLASGEFTLNVGASKVDPNNPKTCLPTVAAKDAALEARMLQIISAKHWDEKSVSIRILTPQWREVRDELTGALVKRTRQAAYASTLNGGCRYQYLLFSQPYVQGSFVGLQLEGVSSVVNISCRCLK